MPLNSAQKQNIDAVLENHLDFSNKSPDIAILALKSMIKATLDAKSVMDLEKAGLISTVDEMRAILAHEYPQNRSTGNNSITGTPDGILAGQAFWSNGIEVLFEPQGIFSLTSLNHPDTEAVTRDDVRNYIRHRIYLEIYQQNLALYKTRWNYQTSKNIDILKYFKEFNITCPLPASTDTAMQALMQKEKYSKYTLIYEGHEITVIAPESLSNLRDKAWIEGNHLGTLIYAKILNHNEANAALKKLNTNPKMLAKRVKDGQQSTPCTFNLNDESHAVLAFQFNGKDPAMLDFIQFLNRYLFNSEIPLFLLNDLLEAAGQKRINYAKDVLYDEGFGSITHRTARIANSTGLTTDKILKLITEFDHNSSDETIAEGAALFNALPFESDEPENFIGNLKKSALLGFPDGLNLLEHLLSEYHFGRENHVALVIELAQFLSSLGSGYGKIMLGNHLIAGIGLPKDIYKAADLFLEAAKIKTPMALEGLVGIALDLVKGKGCSKDIKKATELSIEAGKLGSKNGLHNIAAIACLYYLGKEVPKDIKLAGELFYQAAILGHEGSVINLAQIAKLYYQGEGVPLDIFHGTDLMKQAAMLGHKDAQNFLQNFNDKDFNIDKKHPELMLEIKRHLSELNYSMSKRNRATVYMSGILCQKDFEKAELQLKEAIQLGESDIGPLLFELAAAYYTGTEVAKNTKRAAELTLLAARLGHKTAIDNLKAIGTRFYYGKEVDLDLDFAAILFNEAALHGDIEARNNLVIIGRNYLYGEGVPENTKLALKYLGLAAKRGDTVANFFIASLYLVGSGIPQNIALAAKYFKEAALLGHEESIDNLITISRKYEHGLDVRQDYKRAAQLLHQAALLGSEKAISGLVVLSNKFYKGIGVAKDLAYAVQLAKIASDLQNPMDSKAAQLKIYYNMIRQQLEKENSSLEEKEIQKPTSSHNSGSGEIRKLTEEIGAGENPLQPIAETLPPHLAHRTIENQAEVRSILKTLTTLKDGDKLPDPELALRRAAATGKLNLVNDLLLYVLDINPGQPGPGSGKTALMFAKENGHSEIVAMLGRILPKGITGDYSVPLNESGGLSGPVIEISEFEATSLLSHRKFH